MKKTILALLLAALLGCDTTVKKEETAGLDYGPKPSRWREEIKSYLDLRLPNPKESVVEFRSEPRQLYQRDTLVRERQYGWATCVWVNEMKDGKLSGFYPMTVFMREEKIVAVNNGPDDPGIVASRYAREQCAQLAG